MAPQTIGINNALGGLRRPALFIVALLIVVLMVFAGTAAAQDTAVTDDMVNEIAKKLYCPVCENIPLDTCGTAACEDWREEIRTQLAAGWTEQQIIDDFINQFGERVVGTPQDPTLRNLSLVTPWILVGLGLIAAIYTFVRWQLNAPQKNKNTEVEEQYIAADDLRSQLERDLAER